jgi:chemotaxis protein MotA
MDLGTLVGLILAIVLVFGSIVLGGGAGFFNVPAMMITIGGSFAAVLINYPLPKVVSTLRVVRKAFAHKGDDHLQLFQKMSEFATRARRDGILALEDEIESLDEEFIKKGFQLAVDGNSAEIIRQVLTQDIDSMLERHAVGQGMFKALGNYAPAFGMIGTLIGLVQMLRTLDDPSTIGAGMAVALLTTLYGALVANLIALPIAGKLEQRSEEEVSMKQMSLEGILAIQEGNSPRVVQEKLRSYLAPAVAEQVTADAA